MNTYYERICTALIAVILTGIAAVPAESSNARAGSLPDWSGWWVPQYAAISRKKLNAENPIQMFALPPLKPEYLAAYQKVLQAVLGGQDANAILGLTPDTYCQPFKFNGIGLLVADPEAAIEILLTPDRVTLTDEAGRLRRIFMDGKPVEDAEETNAGVSTGHWEGQTLVIETRALNRNAVVGVGNFKLGRHAEVTERIFLKRKDVLQVDTILFAPEVLVTPFTSTLLFERVPNHVPRETGDCVQHDREIDPNTGHQRFDLTPPADLPPPPAG